MTRCVLLDALGTLVYLEPPWVHLADELGIEPDERLEGAFRAEMSYYRDHSEEAHDPDSLAALRGRCAGVLSDKLGREVSVEQMMGAIRFRPFPDAAPALGELRGLGMRLVCVSNWDFSLPDVLERVGIRAGLDGVVTSAAVGARKPDPRIFQAALELAGCGPGQAIHVGDTRDEDVDGARAAGIAARLIDRGGGGDIESLAAIRHHLSS